MSRKVITLGLIAIFAIFGSITMAGSAKKDIVTTAVEAGSFTTLAKALEAADLVDVLKGEGPYTVFAPTDEAFAKLPEGALNNLLANPDKLKQVLLLHVVPGKVMASDVVKLQSAKTAEGSELSIQVRSNSVMVNGSNVTKADIVASNGVIHVIDRVILPN
jgi:uncharacterized surface protein with fasciclin (FAS1) repeats